MMNSPDNTDAFPKSIEYLFPLPPTEATPDAHDLFDQDQEHQHAGVDHDELLVDTVLSSDDAQADASTEPERSEASDALSISGRKLARKYLLFVGAASLFGVIGLRDEKFTNQLNAMGDIQEFIFEGDVGCTPIEEGLIVDISEHRLEQIEVEQPNIEYALRGGGVFEEIVQHPEVIRGLMDRHELTYIDPSEYVDAILSAATLEEVLGFTQAYFALHSISFDLDQSALNAEVYRAMELRYGETVEELDVNQAAADVLRYFVLLQSMRPTELNDYVDVKGFVLTEFDDESLSGLYHQNEDISYYSLPKLIAGVIDYNLSLDRTVTMSSDRSQTSYERYLLQKMEGGNLAIIASFPGLEGVAHPVERIGHITDHELYHGFDKNFCGFLGQDRDASWRGYDANSSDPLNRVSEYSATGTFPTEDKAEVASWMAVTFLESDTPRSEKADLIRSRYEEAVPGYGYYVTDLYSQALKNRESATD